MKLDPLTSAYLKVIEENASNGAVEATKKQVGKTLGDSTNDSKVKPEACFDNLKNVDIETPAEAPAELTTDGSESEPKELKKGEKLTLKGEAKNPFDALFNKIISEDSFDFSTEDDNALKPSDNFGGPEGLGMASSEENEEEGEDEGFGEEDEEEESVEELFSQLKDLVAKIGTHLGMSEEEGEEEGEEESEEGEGFPEDSREGSEESEETDEDLSEESVEMEELSNEKGLSLTNKKNVVAGAVPVTKKSATVVKGKKVTGKPEEFKNEAGINSLQSKNNKVPAVTTAKYLFDQ